MHQGIQNPAHGVEPESKGSLTLGEFVTVVVQGRRYVTSGVLLALVSGVLYIVFADRTYTVGARVLVQQQGHALERGHTNRRDDEFLATQAEIIRSPAVVTRALETLDVPPMTIGSLDPVGAVLESLAVDPLAGTSVLSIEYYGADADGAVQTVESIIASYEEFLREMDRDSHLQALRLLTRREKELRDDLGARHSAYRELRRTSPLVGRGEDTAEIQRMTLAHLGQTLADARHRRMELENHVEALADSSSQDVATRSDSVIATVATTSHRPFEPRKVESAISIERSALSGWMKSGHWQALAAVLAVAPSATLAGIEDLGAVRQELVRAQIRERELAQRYGDKHPERLAVGEQISAWEKRLSEIVRVAPQVLEQQLNVVQRKEKQLAELYEDEFARAKRIDDYLLMEQQTQEGIVRAEAFHDSLLGQLREWEMADQAVADGRSGVNVRVLEAPALADALVWPPHLLVLLSCGTLGLIGGVAVAFAKQLAEIK